jgi:uncharacterized phosphosugar-binding protein
MENYVNQYFSLVTGQLQQVASQSGEAIRQAAEAVANAIQNNGILLLYGSGHSTLIAKDAAYRAGGLAPALLIEDVAEGDAERLEGLAQYIVARYDLRPPNVLAIISNSGINPVPIEMATLAKAAGVTVIALTSLSHSKAVASRHSSGKKLYELADIVIDTHGVPGDAIVQLPGSSLKSGATSTVVSAAILQAITVQAVSLLIERGHEPPVWISANLPDSETHNAQLLAQYQSRLVRYQMAGRPAHK